MVSWRLIIADVSTRNNSGADAYLIAAYNGHLNVLKYLENTHSWDIYTVDHDGDDAFISASYADHIDIIKYLENKHKWDIYRKNKIGEDAYKVALDYESYDVSDYLNEKMLPDKINNNFVLVTNKTYNDECFICRDKIIKNVVYCKCHKNHIIHKECYVEFLTINQIDKDFKCVYCNEKMYICSFKYWAFLLYEELVHWF